ncbi:S-adenosylmethionine:tRNA ribosyltransferase-isomerase [Geofilum rubicundum]|uniref:S-adenosylmethionine:tRNA ribosyltransferase-isomerase n=1 Tax=Geofilum rubicundum JCM 15548 TaxID=1236989 RepID=A0A0E9LZT4_9BACT|nr:S-adenosylmethionine:tRNA ribosyltransferase-isomerase [Geofilum rubicundum]GAO31077.1 S-adenosylmethionine:tRNA ribosyltransferase-isomerase [Geofilum rubicundum JCM 15548]
MSIPQINISDYDYQLPTGRIAKYPLENRDQSKLLVYKNLHISHTRFFNLPEQLPHNSLLVFNNTKVIRARLEFFKSTGARIELFCLEPYEPSDAALAFQSLGEVQWQCMVGNQKKWKEGSLFATSQTTQGDIQVVATLIKKLSDGAIIQFKWDDAAITFSEIMEGMGQTPIPPYLEREAEDIDTERYQTVYSKYQGSVAAPTAGLHFTDEVLETLAQRNISLIELTLHVGAGTFKPVKTDTIDQHEMHTEHFEVTVNALRQIAEHDGPVIAVGTTSVRTLESIYRAAILLSQNRPHQNVQQWDGFEQVSDMPKAEALKLLIRHLHSQQQPAFKASTSIIITPGYQFKVIDGLITNFHQPRSTLLLLIAALIDENWKAVYDYALNNDFRFLSYGDSSLLLR